MSERDRDQIPTAPVERTSMLMHRNVKLRSFMINGEYWYAAVDIGRVLRLGSGLDVRSHLESGYMTIDLRKFAEANPSLIDLRQTNEGLLIVVNESALERLTYVSTQLNRTYEQDAWWLAAREKATFETPEWVEVVPPEDPKPDPYADVQWVTPRPSVFSSPPPTPPKRGPLPPKNQEYYEEDEPTEKIVAAFESGEKAVVTLPSEAPKESQERIFSYGNLDVRVVAVQGEPWFVATDIAKALGHRDAQTAIRSLRDKEKGTHSVRTSAGLQELTIISEPGLYRLIMRSNRSEAEAFQDWVVGTVLPQIRRTGSYSVDSKPALPQDYASALRAAADAWEAKEVAERQVRELEPSARSYERLVEASGDYSVAEAAKILSRDSRIEIGRDRLFEFMRAQRWIYRSEGHWTPYQTAVNAGRLAQRMHRPIEIDGELRNPAPQVRVTPKGLRDLHRLLGGIQELSIPSTEE